MNFVPLLRAGIIATAVFAVSLIPLSAQAQNNTLRLPQADISAVDNVLQITRVPTIDGQGRIRYNDITISFVVRNNGTIAVPSRNVRVRRSPNTVSAGLTPGRYNAFGTIFTLSQGGITQGGRTIWSLTASCFDATIVGGAIEGHPTVGQRLVDADIDNESLNYGMVSYRNSGCLDSTYFDESTIIGAQMTPDNLVLNSFSRYGNNDVEFPYRTVTFTPCPENESCN